jgi:arylsulfatase A-like enzyme
MTAGRPERPSVIVATGVFRGGVALPPDVPTPATESARAGRPTGHIGTWHLAAEDQPAGPYDQDAHLTPQSRSDMSSTKR